MTGRPSEARSSFRTRLTRSLLSLSLALLTLASMAIYLSVRQALLTNLDTALLTIARTEASSVADSPGQAVHVHEEPPLPLSASSGSGYEKFALIKDASGQVRARTANLMGDLPMQTAPSLETRALGGTISFSDIHRGATQLRGIYYPLPATAGEPMMMVVAVPLEPFHQSLNALLVALGATLILGGGAATWGARRIGQRLTVPLERIAEAARDISEERLEARIPEVAVDAELYSVASALNQMLSRLEQAFEAQRQMVEAQRRFIADASHELRSPLTNLRGTVEVALRRPRSSEEYQEVLTISLTEIERLSRLVDELLTLSRADSEGLPLTLASCNLRELAERAIRAHSVRAEEAGVQLYLEAPASVMTCCDMDRLRKVVDNLLDNALRYAPRGSTITIAVWSEEGKARLSVQDAGPGLTPEEQAHVFDRFYRADASRDRHSGGLGLGLSIARVIMDAHRGGLSVKSGPGDGATFELSLPIDSHQKIPLLSSV